MTADKLKRTLLILAGVLSAVGLVMLALAAMESERAGTSTLQLLSPILGGAWGAVLGARGEDPARGKVAVWAMMGAFSAVVVVGLGVVVIWPLL